MNLPQSIENNGEPWRARTSDPLIKSAVKRTPAGYGSYDLLTSVTGCSRQRVHLLLPITASLSVFWSQVGHKLIPCLEPEAIVRPYHFALLKISHACQLDSRARELLVMFLKVRIQTAGEYSQVLA